MKSYATLYGQNAKFIAPGRLVTVDEIERGAGYEMSQPGFAYHLDEMSKKIEPV